MTSARPGDGALIPVGRVDAASQPATAEPRSYRPSSAAASACLVAAALGFVALDGGSFDLVVRQQWATWLCWLLAVTTPFGLTFRLRLAPTGWVPLAGLAALTGWTATSLIWTSSSELTLTEVARACAYFAVVAAILAFPPQAHWRAIIGGATVAGVLVCCWSLAHRLSPGSFNDVVSIFEGDSRRLSAPFGYWNAVGAWAGMTTALCLGWSAHADRWATRAIALAAIPVTTATAYLTYSRAAVGGSVLGLVVLLALSRNRATLVLNAVIALATSVTVVVIIRGQPGIADATSGKGWSTVLGSILVTALICGVTAWLTSRVGADDLRLSPRVTRVVVPVAVVLAVFGLATAAASFGPQAWDSFTTSDLREAGDPASRLTTLNGYRHLHWEVALDEFSAHPWTGTGAGTYEYSWNQSGYSGFVRDAHSLYLETMAELGVPGLLALLAFIAGLGFVLWSALRRASGAPERGAVAGAAAAVAAYAFGAGVDWLWESPAVTVMALTLVGAMVLAGARGASAPRWPWRLAITLGAVVAALVQLPGLVSTSEIRKSQDALRAGDVRAARAHADEAINTQPWAGSAWIQRALVDERAGAYAAAAMELRRAAARQPKNWRVPLLLARVEARRGNAKEALASYRRAKQLRPKSQFFASG